MKMPAMKDVAKTAKQTGSVAGGIIASHILKEALMGTSLLNRPEPILPDTILTNAGGVVASFAGAVAANHFVNGDSKEYIVLACAGAGAYFLIRLINKATDGLKGLGAEGEPNQLKEWLNKLVPRLDGMGNVSDPTPAQVADFQRMIAQYQPGATVQQAVDAQFYGLGNEQMTKNLLINAA